MIMSLRKIFFPFLSNAFGKNTFLVNSDYIMNIKTYEANVNIYYRTKNLILLTFVIKKRSSVVHKNIVLKKYSWRHS